MRLRISKKSCIFARHFDVMNKIFAIIVAIGIALSGFAETVFTFTYAADMNQTQGGYTVVIAQGTSSNAPSATVDYQSQEPEMRLYAGNTITVSGDVAITNIQMVFAKSSASNKQYTGLSANTGELVSGGVSEDKNDWKVDRWTGNATSVVFTLTNTGQRRIQRLVVDGEPVSIDTTAYALPTAEDLDAGYNYAEPTEVLPKDTVVWKEEYAFISNNILVHCDQGSIVKATDTTFAYFNCNAGYTLTFTATQAIKGIEIDGFVRKAFDASCDHGTIQYLTNPDQDMEGWPAMVLLDVDAERVTLSCPKQLRCYGVRVYFLENPDPLFENIEQTKPAAQAAKMLKNGQLYIIRNGRTYTTAGTEVK